jgi:hypothetical protein
MAALIGGKSIMGAKPAPTVAPPAVMPTIDDEAVRRAKRNAIASAQQRGGRASTILSDGAKEDKLG